MGFSTTETLSTLALFAIVLTATLAFTDKDCLMLSGIADDRAVRESERALPDRASSIASYSAQAGFTNREKEIFELLLRGRNTAYIAQQLVLAESTVRAHVHNVYRKCDVHSRMELLDDFEQFRRDSIQQREQH